MTSPHRLVVIGNGMAGARLVEDVLARASGDRFRHHHVRRRAVRQLQPHPALGRARRHPAAGRHLHQPARLVRRQRRDAARRRRRDRASTARRRWSTARTAGPSPTTRWSSPPAAVPFVPPFENLAPTEPAHGPGAATRTASSCSAPSRTASACWPAPPTCKSAAVIGGGLLGLEAARGLSGRGLEVNVVHLMEHLMEMQLDRDAGLMLQKSMEQLGRQGAPRQVDDRPPRQRLRHRPAVQGRLDARVRPAGHRRRHPAERRAGEGGRPRRSSAASSSTTAWRTSRPVDLRRRRVRRAPRPGLRPGGAALGADGGAGRSADRRAPRTRSTKARGPRPSSR